MQKEITNDFFNVDNMSIDKINAIVSCIKSRMCIDNSTSQTLQQIAFFILNRTINVTHQIVQITRKNNDKNHLTQNTSKNFQDFFVKCFNHDRNFYNIACSCVNTNFIARLLSIYDAKLIMIQFIFCYFFIKSESNFTMS